MTYSTNLIYNGDFAQGTDSWSGTNLSVTNGELTVTGNLSQNIFVPVASNRRYKITYDLKVTNNCGSSFYIALFPFDNKRSYVIDIATTNKIANTDTTLAANLKSGDTTVTLTSGSNWTSNLSPTRYLGICDKLAWGYGRATSVFALSAVSGNTLTLKNAYSGSTIAAGTKVAQFSAGGTYFYPHYLSTSALPTEWTTYTAEFNGGNSMRYSCQYFKFTTLGYTHTYQMRNIKIECISDEQYCPYEKSDIHLSKQGELFSNRFNETGMNIRYVRDSIHGSTANGANHWNEVKIINDVGENLAWGHSFTVNGTTYTDGYCHDNTVSNTYFDGGSAGTTITFDLGYPENIQQIQIWHYYPDGRTYYNNVTEVSADGVKWIPVYSGEKPETSAGNIIYLNPYQTQFFKSGIIKAKNFYEI